MGGYDHRPLAGIGGWLTFLLLVIGVFTPLRIIFETVGFFNDAAIRDYLGDRWTAVSSWQGVVTAIQLGGFGFMTWRMIKVQIWQSVRIVIAGLWILGPGVVLIDLVLTLLLTGLPIGTLLSGIGLLPVQVLFFASLWTAYLLRSERVANTYLRYPEDEVAEVFT